MMVGIFVVLLVLCMVAARVLTTKLVAPIEKLAQNIGECTEMQTYEELTPFMSMIRKQHEDIMKNANITSEGLVYLMSENGRMITSSNSSILQKMQKKGGTARRSYSCAVRLFSLRK